ncbi:hypothetical protein BELL_0621g00060 [Botrytis elliptica]|uniref:Uncharacterized protein n=1 Tax=Botrytis elliptica TaxID=278938 RepID=A0A4Z1JBI1_9HELO|nr:hypothetical protein BELL_0621g00060 [Botrytis elliptica]
MFLEARPILFDFQLSSGRNVNDHDLEQHDYYLKTALFLITQVVRRQPNFSGDAMTSVNINAQDISEDVEHKTDLQSHIQNPAIAFRESKDNQL